MSTEAAQVCPTCGQEVIPPLDVPSLQRQAAEVPDHDPDHELVDSFESLTLGLPKSVVGKITAKLERVGIDYSGAIDSPEVRAVVDAARVSYGQKKDRARLASAKRRAVAKQQAKSKGPAEPEPPMEWTDGTSD